MMSLDLLTLCTRKQKQNKKHAVMVAMMMMIIITMSLEPPQTGSKKYVSERNRQTKEQTKTKEQTQKQIYNKTGT